MEILEIKNKILQIKTSMDGLKNRMMMTEARVSKPEDVNQSKEEEKVLQKKKDQSFRNLGDNNKKFNAYNWSSKKERRENWG